MFKGNSMVGADEESAKLWEDAGISPKKIKYLGEDDNW